MSKATYRKIVVNDIEYRWIAGRDATKVQNRATGETRIYKNAEWATPHLIPDWERLRGAEYLGDLGLDEDNMVVSYHASSKAPWIVGPGDVRGMIVGERKWKDRTCRYHRHRVVTGLCYDPFAAEIEARHVLGSNCPQCMLASWMNT